MKHFAFPSAVFVFAAMVLLPAPAFSANRELDEAIALVKQMHVDQCEQRQLRGQLLMAHQSHDQETLDTLGPRLEAVNQRLKPSEDRLKGLKLSLKKNAAGQSAFDAALQEAGSCDDP